MKLLVPTKQWESILGFYRALEGENACFAPMQRLVAHVAAQPYSTLLFGTTSMQALLVAQHDRIEWGHDVLRVEVKPDGQTARFAYQEQQYVQPAAWECAEDKIVETFEGFLRRARWITM